MHRPATVRVVVTALVVGVAAEVLLDGHLPGLNVPIVTAVELAAIVAVAGGPRQIDPFDRWIPVMALVLAAFVAIRDDVPLVLLDLAGALGLTAASAPAFAGQAVTRRATLAIVDLAGRVVAAVVVGAVPLVGRLTGEVELRRPATRAVARFVPVARGLLIVLPFLVVFAGLFAAADPIFGRLLDTAFSLDVALGDLPGRIVFVGASAWLVGGLLWFVLIVDESSVPPAPRARSLGAAATGGVGDGLLGPIRVGPVEAVTFLLALDVLFGVFVVLQLAYLFGSADTLAAIGMTYSSYARRGFFELVAVVVLVGGLVLGLESLVARRPRAYVAAALGLVGLTSVVLASSFVRLRLYQDAYGWTELRFYVLAAIVFLGLCLAAAAVLVAGDRSRRLPHAIAASSLIVLVLVNLAGPQAWITDRNLERALVPSVVPDYGEAALDAPYLGQFGADAVPSLVAALPALPEPQRSDLEQALRQAHGRYVADRDPAWQAANLARWRAREALETLFGG